MSHISERELVHAPLAAADSLLTQFLEANPAPKGEGARVVLRAAGASEPVIITVAKAHRPADMTPRYAVHWEDEGGGVFPIFDGFLTIGADQDYNTFFLVLEGDYVPPGGLAGKMFDMAVGNRIAAESARNLLIAIRTAVETVFGEQERKKVRL